MPNWEKVPAVFWCVLKTVVETHTFLVSSRKEEENVGIFFLFGVNRVSHAAAENAIVNSPRKKQQKNGKHRHRFVASLPWGVFFNMWGGGKYNGQIAEDKKKKSKCLLWIIHVFLSRKKNGSRLYGGGGGSHTQRVLCLPATSIFCFIFFSGFLFEIQVRHGLEEFLLALSLSRQWLSSIPCLPYFKIYIQKQVVGIHTNKNSFVAYINTVKSKIPSTVSSSYYERPKLNFFFNFFLTIWSRTFF